MDAEPFLVLFPFQNGPDPFRLMFETAKLSEISEAEAHLLRHAKTKSKWLTHISIVEGSHRERWFCSSGPHDGDGMCVCGKTEIKNHFTIRNVDTGADLAIGSECIKKYLPHLGEEVDRRLGEYKLLKEAERAASCGQRYSVAVLNRAFRNGWLDNVERQLYRHVSKYGKYVNDTTWRLALKHGFLDRGGANSGERLTLIVEDILGKVIQSGRLLKPAAESECAYQLTACPENTRGCALDRENDAWYWYGIDVMAPAIVSPLLTNVRKSLLFWRSLTMWQYPSQTIATATLNGWLSESEATAYEEVRSNASAYAESNTLSPSDAWNADEMKVLHPVHRTLEKVIALGWLNDTRLSHTRVHKLAKKPAHERLPHACNERDKWFWRGVLELDCPEDVKEVMTGQTMFWDYSRWMEIVHAREAWIRRAG